MQKAGFLFLPGLAVAKATFAKEAATPEQLLQKLQDRGLDVPACEQPAALAYLRYVGGYRLKGYWFQAIDPLTKRFPAGYTFEDISQRYELDRELRAASIAAIDRLEVAIRTVMANHLSLAHSPHWFLRVEIFKPTHRWGLGRFIKKIEDEVGRAKSSRFVSHYFAHYDEPYLPPSWVICECVSFGLWSQTYSTLRHIQDKKAISKRFGVDQVEVFQSWIHTLTVIRNIAAHHGQLLGVKLGVSPANFKAKAIILNSNKSFFNAATIIQYLLFHVGLPHTWREDLEAIFRRYPHVSIEELGFPNNWQNAPGW